MSTGCPAAPSTTNVSSLVPSWYVHTTDVVTATPTVVGGTVYVGDWSGTFYAIDQKTGGVNWSTTIGRGRSDGQADHHNGAYGVITSSAAVASFGKKQVAFVGAGDSLYAIDASTKAIPDAQRVLWRTDLDPKHPTSHGEIESSPVVWAGAPGGPVVIVGSDANQDSGYTGEGVWAIRAATGQPVWHFSETSTGHPLYGCANVWSSPALGLDPKNPDPAKRAVVYFGEADCPDNSGTLCPPDGSDLYCPPGQKYDYSKRWSKFAEAIVAINATDGSPVWTVQTHPRLNQDDDDYGPSAQLYSLPSGQKVVGEANKDGSYTVIDRNSGVVISKTAETGNGNIQPGFALGGFLGTTAVITVDHGPRVFGGSAINTPITYDAGGNPTSQPPSTLAKQGNAMTAFSGTNGAPAWSAVQGYTYGATSAANGVVYVGALDSMIRAYDASTGLLLWSFTTGAPMSSGAAITSRSIVVGTGTSESDVEFKTCDRAPAPAVASCKSTPLNATLNPLSNLNGVYTFTLAG